LDDDHDDGKADAHEQRHSITPLDRGIGPNVLASPQENGDENVSDVT
jgi:hypothetical protein